MFSKNMKILVTGGMGFIGKHLVTYLSKKGYIVTILDNFSNSDKSSVSSFSDKGIKIIEGDITKIQDILDATKDQDIVIHLAAKISVEKSIRNPSETFHTNVDGTKNVLVACEKNHIKKLIVASSAAVYGESLPDTKLTENSKIDPISPYGESKYQMEQEIKKIILKYDVNCIILRFFNIYGIGQTSEYAGVISKFIDRIDLNKPLKIFGDGMQKRDFVAVQDVIGAIDNSIEYGKNGIYNIASGKTSTIKEIAEMMISLSGKNLKIEFLSSKKGDIKYSQADISLAKNELNYFPKFNLKEIKNLLKQ